MGGYRSIIARWLGGLVSPGGSPPVVYAGDDVLEALQSWWDANGTGYTADGALWHLEAPETTDLPYATFFLVSEEVELMTTGGGQSYRSHVQMNCHASTSGDAWALAKTLRSAIKGAPLVVGGNAVWHVRPDAMIAPVVGEGRGPDGQDCWIAGVTFDIPWNM